MPTTGPAAASRAASSPVSPKQAITYASTPMASPANTSSTTPRVATASSTLHSTDGVPVAGWLARISVPGAATARPAPRLSWVNAAVVFGLMIWMRIACGQRYPCCAGTESRAGSLEFRLHGNADRPRSQGVALGDAVDLRRLQYGLVVGQVLGECRHLEDAHRDAGIQVHDAV